MVSPNNLKSTQWTWPSPSRGWWSPAVLPCPALPTKQTGISFFNEWTTKLPRTKHINSSCTLPGQFFSGEVVLVFVNSLLEVTEQCILRVEQFVHWPPDYGKRHHPARQELEVHAFIQTYRKQHGILGWFCCPGICFCFPCRFVSNEQDSETQGYISIVSTVWWKIPDLSQSHFPTSIALVTSEYHS